MMTNRSYEVAIIGGGIIGSFTAYFLARYGVKTCVVERGFPATGTSGATLAWVFTSLKPPVHYALMHQKSVAQYEELAKRHGIDFGLRRTGSLWLVWDEQEWSELEQEVAQLREGGIQVELLSAGEVQRLEPKLDPAAIIGAAYGPRDGSVNPFLANMNMARLSRELGVQWYIYTTVLNIDRYNGIYRLHTSAGCIEAEKVVIAAGIWSRDIGRMIGFPIPIIPVRGQILVSAPLTERFFTHTIGNAFLTQHPETGALLIGSSQEHGEAANVSTWDGICGITKKVLRVAPFLKNVPVIRAFSGVRPIPFDGFPLLGELPGHQGIFIAITHSGFSLAPLVGLCTAELITGREPAFDIKPYLIERMLYTQASREKFAKIR